MQIGDTFMLEDEDEAGEHLHVILTNPSLADEIVTACICTRRRWTESLVIVQPGDHPFIRHESAVPFRFSVITTTSAIQNAVSRGQARLKEPASPELVRRIIAGLLDSDFTPPGVRAYYIATTQV
jgi:hypothetical protein